MHGYSASVDEADEDDGEFRTPSRRGTYSKFDPDGVVPSGIPMPSRRLSNGVMRRTSSISVSSLSVSGGMIGRPSSSMGFRTPRPPSVAGGRPLDDLGETY